MTAILRSLYARALAAPERHCDPFVTRAIAFGRFDIRLALPPRGDLGETR